METLQKTALVFTIIGALNWLLVGLFDFNLVNYLFVELINMKILATIVYIIVGVCGIINIGLLFILLNVLFCFTKIFDFLFSMTIFA